MLEFEVKCKRCGKPAYIVNRRLCNSCYLWLRRRGLLEPLEKIEQRRIPCTTEGCPKTISIKSKTMYCAKCWRRLGRNGKEKVVKRRASLKNNFKISAEEYNRMLLDQNNVCKICKQPETIIDNRTKELRNLHVDHDHKTGQIRGLLCSSCNTGLGHADHNTELLERMLVYLDKI